MSERDITITPKPGRGRPSVIVDNISDVHDPTKYYSLSLRELEVLKMRRDGMIQKEIAEALGITFHTVHDLFINAIDRNSQGENSPRVSVISLLLAAEASGLLDNGMLETLSGIADGTVTVEEGLDTLRARQDLTTIFPPADALP